LIKTKPVVKPESWFWIAFFPISSGLLNYRIWVLPKNKETFFKKIKISKYNLKSWIQKQT